MGDDELTNYIIRAREKGRTREQIVRALSSVGWKREKIDTAFRKLDESHSWQKDAAAQQSAQARPAPTPAQTLQQPLAEQMARPAQQQAAAPMQLVPAAKKPLFAFPPLFGKKPAVMAQQAQTPQQQQPAAQQQMAQPAQLLQQQAPQVSNPLQEQQKMQPPPSAAPPVASETAQQPLPSPQAQPAAAKQQGQTAQQYSSGGPSTTFTFGTQQVTFGAAQAAPAPGKAVPTTTNPAFSNLMAAAAGMAGKRNMLPIIAAVAILLFAVGYIIQSQSPAVPATGQQINLTKLQQQEKNVTKPVVPAAPKPVSKNTTNKSVATPPKNPVQNTTKPASQNATTPPPPPKQQNQSPGGNQQFSRYSLFLTSSGDPPSKFCQNQNAALFRVHYVEYSGTGCGAENGKEGYISPTNFPYACGSIPCCYNDAAKGISRLYNIFECGYYG